LGEAIFQFLTFFKLPAAAVVVVVARRRKKEAEKITTHSLARSLLLLLCARSFPAAFNLNLNVVVSE
jgi:hypothetical protein